MMEMFMNERNMYCNERMINIVKQAEVYVDMWMSADRRENGDMDMIAMSGVEVLLHRELLNECFEGDQTAAGTIALLCASMCIGRTSRYTERDFFELVDRFNRVCDSFGYHCGVKVSFDAYVFKGLAKYEPAYLREFETMAEILRYAA